MGTSLSSGEIRYSYAELGTDRFADTAIMRDMVDTALHKADEAAQVRLHWVASAAGVWVENNDAHDVPFGQEDTEGGLATGTETWPRWYFGGARAMYAPKLRAGGQGYQLRVRLAGRCSSAGECDFGILVAPGRARLAFYYADGSPGDGSAGYPAAVKTYSGVTSTTAAWLTPDDASHLIYVNPAIVEAAYAMESIRTTEVDLGGAPTALVVPTLQIVPYAQTLTDGVKPQFFGVHAAEFVGKT